MLIRNNNWRLLNDLNQILDASLRHCGSDDSNVESGDWIPAVDIKEEDNKFLLFVDIPGVNPKNVEIFMENNVLTLKGSSEDKLDKNKEGYHRIERFKGSFHRRFTLPDTADSEQVSAKYHHGVLEITIGKKRVGESRKISIETLN